MEIKKTIAIASLTITLVIFITILFIGNLLDTKREEKIDSEFEQIFREFRNMETLFLMTEFYDDKMACLAFEEKLKELDETIWEMGKRLERYRSASEEFYESGYYKKQKKAFNENQVYYYLLMKRMIEECDIKKSTILFFYADSSECDKCDDQSFILSDINELDNERGKYEVAVFPLDMDLNITTINLLHSYYEVEKLPCLIIDEEKHCGIRGSNFIVEEICKKDDYYLCDLHKKRR